MHRKIIIGDDLMNYYSDIKELLINNELTKKIKDYSKNKSDLTTYYNVGKLLSEAGKHYGEGIIKEYSKKLTSELGKKYSVRLLYKVRKFYNFLTKEKLPTVSAKLSWSHFDELLSIKDANKLNYYIKISEEQNLSVRELRKRIKSNEYERLPSKTKEKLIKQEEPSITDSIKNPILIKNNYNYQNISEKMLQKLILEDIEPFMKELGDGYTYVGNEYKIKIGDKYNYIDLLLFNYEYNCFVVIELKVTEYKAEYLGQILKYVNYVDENIKKPFHDKTIGIIICKENNQFVLKYSTDSRIFNTTYELV